ncbi:MAG: alkyl hydroperoxide reductase subunit F, partial [Xanthomonadales bacterium]|nr:alkyl hydroperoxide reductase subunit F [Xanthomonadales bacterium]
MLDSNLTSQLQAYLTRVVLPIELVATLDDSELSTELDGMLGEIAALSDRIGYRKDGSASRAPSFEIRRVDSDIAVSFAGIPLGHEFTSLVLALLQVGGHPPKVDDAVVDQIRSLGQ